MTQGFLSSRVLFGLAFAALLAGWLAPPAQPADVALVRARRDAWVLPVLPRPQHPGAMPVVVAAAPMWGSDPKPVATTPAADLRWRLAGLYGSGRAGGAVLIFLDPTKPPQRLKVGDKLPDGQAIVAVEGNELVVRNVKKKLERLPVERYE
ncbi:hypothetical protein [Roseateles sp. P5_E11]